MKIIFLDIDGTLNRYWFTRERVFGGRGGLIGIDQENLSWFFNVLSKTDAKIVLVSTWRKIDRLVSYFKDTLGPRFQDRYIDNTCEIYNPDGSSNNCRHKEIERWLSQHPEVTKYVILDAEHYVVDSPIGKGLAVWLTSVDGFQEEHQEIVLDFMKG